MHVSFEEFQALEHRLGEGGKLGLSAQFINPAGEIQGRLDYRGDEWFPMASVVKVPIGLALELMSHRGEVSLDEEQTVTSFSACPGPLKNPLDKLFFAPWSAKRLVTLRHLLNVMLAHSDNTAADAILEKLGGPDIVQTFLANLGIERISIKSTIYELLSHYYDLPPRPHRQAVPARALFLLKTIFKLRSPWVCRPDKEPGMVAGGGRSDSCTPMATTELLSIASSDPRFIQTRNVLKACKVGKARIPRGLKAIRSKKWRGACLYHKTGTLGGIANDVGFVVGDDGSRVVLSIFTRGASSSLATRENVIARVAERTITTLDCMEAKTHRAEAARWAANLTQDDLLTVLWLVGSFAMTGCRDLRWLLASHLPRRDGEHACRRVHDRFAALFDVPPNDQADLSPALPVISDELRGRLRGGKYSRWAVDLNDAQLHVILANIGSFAQEADSVLDLLHEWVSEAPFPPGAFREAFALRSLVKIVRGKRYSLHEYCGRVTRGMRSLQHRNKAEPWTDECLPRKAGKRQ